MTSSTPISHFISVLRIKVHYNLAIPNQSIINNNHVGYPINGFDYAFSYRKLEKSFFFYEQIGRLSLYFSILFDHYLTNIIIIKSR